jgi:hypothetical protein
MKKNLLTGEAITVAPYKQPNPFYLMPLLLLLVVLIAVIALHKADISEKMKKVLTALHFLLIIGILVMLLLTFNIAQPTGAAVVEFVGESGASGIALTVLVSALLLGGMAYVAVSRGLVDLGDMEQYYSKSKYWIGYAVQKIEWSKKKKIRTNIEVETRYETPTTQPQAALKTPTLPSEKKTATAETAVATAVTTARPDGKRMTAAETIAPKEQMMFGSIMTEIKDLNLKIEELKKEVVSVAPARPESVKEKRQIEAKNAKDLMPKPALVPKAGIKAPFQKISPLKVLRVQPRTIITERKPVIKPVTNPIMPKAAAKPVQPAARPKIDVKIDAKKEPLKARFRTDYPLKIAEMILKKSQKRTRR